jgi:hypothetical protein
VQPDKAASSALAGLNRLFAPICKYCRFIFKVSVSLPWNSPPFSRVRFGR